MHKRRLNEYSVSVRTGSLTRLAGDIGVICVGIPLGIAVVSLLTDIEFSWTTAGSACVGVCIVFALTYIRGRVFVSPEGLVVRNLFSIDRIAWTEIADIHPRSSRILFRDNRGWPREALIRSSRGEDFTVQAIKSPFLVVRPDRPNPDAELCKTLMQLRDLAISNGGVIPLEDHTFQSFLNYSPVQWSTSSAI